MQLLVTGGAGFIGCNFIRQVLETHPDYKVINLDKLTYAGNPENLKTIEEHANYQFVQGDICDPQVVHDCMKGVDTIVNFAAETHVDRSLMQPESFIKTDIYGTYNLLEAAKQHHVSRYIQISTDEVYGSIDSGQFTENSPIHPNSPYAASKAAADLVAQSYFRSFSLPVLITRSSNNFGPYQYPEKFIPLFITNALEKKPLPLYGDGLNVRDWIFVSDNCRAIDLVIHKGKPGNVYNIGGSNEKTNIDVAKEILGLLDLPENMIQLVKDRPGHDRRYALNRDKILALGFKPSGSFENNLSATVSWYKNNRAWWQKIKSGEFRQYYEKMYKDRVAT